MDVLVKGQPALVDASKCACAWAGVIEVTDAGKKLMSCGSGGPASQGAAETYPRQKIAYKVTEYSKKRSEMSGEDKSKKIRWAVRVGNKEKELEDKRGEKITLDIDKDWEGKEILVMAYIENTEKASQKTKVLQDNFKGTLIRGVVGEDEAFPGQMVEYKVTNSNKDGEAGKVNDGSDVKWAIKVGNGGIDRDMLKGEYGKKIISLKMKPGWSGKEIAVMPYLNSPTETVSVKTRVERLELPKMIIETKRIEGKEEDGITKAKDMHFGLKSGDTHIHTDDFKLEQIGNMELRKAIEEDLRCSDGTLFERFDKLILYTSKFPLQREIREMASKMRRLKSSDVNADKSKKPEEYSNDIITRAVFKHEETEEFIEGKEGVKNRIISLIKSHNGNINKIEKNMTTNYGKDNPKYSSTDDLKNGLTVAINDTWGHRAEIIGYEYDSDSKKFSAELKIRIFDHFGLDYEDIKKYGTAKLVSDSIWKKLTNFPVPITIPYFAGLAAEGFRAWFILQHYRGYRPFVNIMEGKISIDGKITG